jgi:hypothetical protein
VLAGVKERVAPGIGTVESRRDVVVGRGESRNGREDGTKIPGTGKLPSEVASERNWRTRADPFAEVWGELREKLEVNPGLQSKDAVRGSSASASGRVRRRATADPAASGEDVASA